MKGPAATSCPPDATFVALVEGRLRGLEAEELEDHARECATCRVMVEDLRPTGVSSVALAATLRRPSTPGTSTDRDDALLIARVAEGTSVRGALVGRYLVMSLLGRGGMGEVYAAYDPELDRRVALKLLRTERQPDAARSRFSREAWGLARLSHPNVVQVHDVGEHEGNVFVAMELIEGESLDVWCHGPDKPSWRAVLAAYLDAARGLAAAHEKGLIHRDVKPSNILRGKDGRVRVADFGLVAAAEQAPGAPPPVAEALSHDGSGSLTAPGTILGTPLYIAPEQLSGAATPASDQYSLCAALYEGLYGTPPLDMAREERGLTILRLAALKREGPPGAPPPGTDVPPAVFGALVRGLATRPEDRYPSLGALISALEGAAAPPRTSRRWGALVGAVAVALAAVGAVAWTRRAAPVDPCAHPEQALAGVWDDGIRAQVRATFTATGRSYAGDTAARVEALLDRQATDYAAMRREVCEAERSQKETRVIVELRDACLERRRGQLRALGVVFAEKPDTRVLDKAVQAAGELSPVAYCGDIEALTSRVRPPDDPEVRARVAAVQPEVDRLEALYNTGKYKDGIQAGDRILEAASQIPYPPISAQAHYWIGQMNDNTGAYEPAKVLLIKAAELGAEGGDDILVAKAWARVLFILVERQRRFDEASALRRVGPTLLAHARDDRAHAAWLSAEGLLLGYTAHYPEAIESAQRSIELAEKALGPDHSFAANTRNNLGNIYFLKSDYAHARAEHERVLLIRVKALGHDHPAVGLAVNNLALDLEALGEPRRAMAMYAEATSVLEGALGPEAPDVAIAVENLALTHTDVGEWAEALPLAERALTIREKVLGPEHALVGQSSLNVGTILSKLSAQTVRGFLLLRRALSISEATLGKDHRDVAYPLVALGRAYTQAGDLGSAATALERARELREKNATDGDPVRREALLGLGEVALARHRPADAVALLERALAVETAALQGDTELALAEALWSSRLDRARARDLAAKASAEYTRIGHPSGLEQATRWLAGHGP